MEKRGALRCKQYKNGRCFQWDDNGWYGERGLEKEEEEQADLERRGAFTCKQSKGGRCIQWNLGNSYGPKSAHE